MLDIECSLAVASVGAHLESLLACATTDCFLAFASQLRAASALSFLKVASCFKICKNGDVTVQQSGPGDLVNATIELGQRLQFQFDSQSHQSVRLTVFPTEPAQLTCGMYFQK